MIQQTLEQALTLTPGGDGGLTADLHGDFSNGVISAAPETGFPFGGLIAALAAAAMAQGLAISAPLRSLSVQYMTPARFGRPLAFAPRLLRGGRSAAFAQVDVRQDDRLTNHATATFGDDVPGTVMAPLTILPPRQALETGGQLDGPLAPRFSQYVDYRFDGGPHILQATEGRPVIERVWMRLKGGRPLDAIGLCYLMDAIYPPVWTALKRPVGMATVDLRYDILTDPTPRALRTAGPFSSSACWTSARAGRWMRRPPGPPMAHPWPCRVSVENWHLSAQGANRLPPEPSQSRPRDATSASR